MPHPNGRSPSMAPTPREGEWRRILDRWRRSGATCRAFCRRETLDENSFYHWKREVRLRDERRRADRAAPPRRTRKPKPSLHWPEESRPETSANRSLATAVDGSDLTRGAVHFHPVRLTPARPLCGGDSVPALFEIAFPDGRLLRVGADFDAAALTRLLPLLDAPTARDPGRGGSPC